MNDDVLFRSSVYGFNKEDVLNYIEKIKKENENQKNLATKSAMELSNAFKRINELEKKLLVQRQMADALNLENRQYQAKMTKEVQNFSSNTLIDDANTVDYIGEVDRVKNENVKLRTAVQQLKLECERFKDIEKQFGSMLLDAYIYSGNILDDAREKADKITKGTRSTIEQAAGDMGEFSSYVNNISTGFSQIVSELTDDIKNITENLMSVTKKFQQQSNDENEEFKAPDINTYINDSQDQEINSEFNAQGTVVADKVSGFDEYIKMFETMISGEQSEVEQQEPQEDFQEKQGQDTNEVYEQSKEHSNELECPCLQASNEEVSNPEQNVDELIGEYVQSNEQISQQYMEDEITQPEQHNNVQQDEHVEANFISSAPIGGAYESAEPVIPLSPVVRFDENFKLKEQTNQLDPDVTLGANPLGASEDLETFEPLQCGLDYSSFFQYEDDTPQENSDEQFNNMVNEYASCQVENIKENEENITVDTVYQNIENKNEQQSENVDSSTVTLKRVDAEIDEPMMFDPNGLYKTEEDQQGKSRFGRVKLKMKKDK